MRMMNSMIYNIKEGVRGILKNGTMSIASIGSVAASLFILGIVLSIVLNINNIMLLAQQQFDKVQVFLHEDINEKDILAMRESIKDIDGVSKVEFESKDDALKKLKERWGEDAYLLEGIDNPLQNSFIISIESLEDADYVVSSLRNYTEIEDIKYYKDIIDKLINISNTIRTVGLILITLLSMLSLFIISNTVKLALHARKKEINIMKYIGATDWFIRWPFIIEGIVLGGLGSALAFGIIYFSYDGIYEKLGDPTYSAFAEYVLPISQISSTLATIFVVMGISIGVLGSIFSLRKYLRV
ncbi:permease-like cell division protein FtsX [Alkalithermobacter paradoxus]|uniref:Cell division protein FtsX n=1 Tax=Alkalithermobacter paradoxus TaxID=29349 RepID=A0A1V4I5K8_9FIRM|nr:cell division protein FtsX [[Clostridium] thermoalcaliphilum]